MKRSALALLLCLIAFAAVAQPVTSIGPVTPGNFPIYNSPTVIKDSGYSPTTLFNAVCTLAPTVCTKMLGYVSISWYGAACNSVTNDFTAIQTAWTAAAAANVDVWLVGGSGATSVSCNIGTNTLVMPTPINQGGSTGFSKASMLKGPGSGLMRLLSTDAGAGTTCAISISVTYGSNSSLGGVMGGFTILQGLANQAGYGICLTNVTSLNLDDIAIQYFGNGILANDSISVNMTRMWFELNRNGINARYVSTTAPNAWNVSQSNFNSQTQYAIITTGTSSVGAKVFNIDHDTFQSNGSAGGAGTIYNEFDCSAPYGGVGLNINNNYFEGNTGVEVEFDAGSAANTQCVHNFKNNYIVRSLSGLTGGIQIANSGTGTYQVTVNVEGNYFSDVLLTGSAYQWLAFVSPSTFNSTFICDGNRVNVAAEINSRCGNVAASKTKSSDANAQWVGYN